jgi:hypothetical protein
VALVEVGLAVKEGVIVGVFVVVVVVVAPHASTGTLKHVLPVGHPSPDGQRIDKSRQFA